MFNLSTIFHKTEHYNSNNAWGFGGAYGTKYIFNDELWCLVGKACTRHRGEFPFITITHNDVRIFDECHSKENFNKAEQIIKDILEGKTHDQINESLNNNI